MNTRTFAVVRYYATLFAGSQRWLAPALLYGIVLAIDSTGGDTAADAFAYSAAFLLPVAAWMTRSMLTTEPAESAAMVATLVGPVRARLAALTAATCYALLCAVLGAVVALTAGSHGGGSTTAAGLVTELLCVLLGTAAGAVAAPPLVRPTGWGVLLVGLLSLGLLIARFSPADAAIRSLTAVSNGGALHFPYWAPPFALVITAVAWAGAAHAATRHVP
ncbi:hypothetical protein KDL01_18550 [Actinospica durhamensis]|uniref:ABC transporter n=1 Tax=Actinospica durhamensis TaxID=1508375 RepID=A0A941EQI6_9ACTN|nr:hypothetical protein [Actinospica durhamensis]MBR7835281.1 hypothetical protein [Actinospica durhamensis]